MKLKGNQLKMTKILVVFYSRSGNTKKVAKSVSDILKCDIEEIFDTKNRKGVFGFLSAGSDARNNRDIKIKEIKINPSLYDLVIIGTPVWAGNISAPIRTYISKNKDNFKKVAFFCTHLSPEVMKIFKDMETVCQKTPLSLLEVTSREVKKNQYIQKVEEFIENLNKEIKKQNESK